MICQIPSLRLCTNSYFDTEKFLCAKLADNIFDPVMSTRTSLLALLSKIHRQNREIQNQLELAKQQQEEFSLITENMQEGLIVIDKYTMILSANSSAWNLFHMDSFS